MTMMKTFAEYAGAVISLIFAGIQMMSGNLTRAIPALGGHPAHYCSAKLEVKWLRSDLRFRQEGSLQACSTSELVRLCVDREPSNLPDGPYELRFRGQTEKVSRRGGYWVMKRL